MIPPKLEECPICDASLSQAEYDGQFHSDHWRTFPPLFIHMRQKVDACDHDFGGWRELADGRGGEQFCRKCGMGAMEHTLRNDPT